MRRAMGKDLDSQEKDPCACMVKRWLALAVYNGQEEGWAGDGDKDQ